MKKIIKGVAIGILGTILVWVVMNYYGQAFQAKKDLGLSNKTVEAYEKANRDLAAENKELWDANKEFKRTMDIMVPGVKKICYEFGYAEKDPAYCGQFK